nr:hypothetical protein 102 [bacterium]
MTTSIIGASLPLKKTEECGEIIEINCDDAEIKSNTASEAYEVVFPVGSGQTLPLSGGAVVRLDLSALSTDLDENIINLLNREGEKLLDKTFESSIEGLAASKLEINSIIFDVGKSAALDDFIQIFVSTFTGDDSSLKSNTANADVIKVCELRYIPAGVLETISESLLALEDSGTFGTSEEPMYGASGNKLSGYPTINTEDLAVAAVIDFLPFYNISEDEIVKKRGNPSTGGYYTIVDGKAYLKIPDLTGRDSAGFDPDLYNEDEERNLYFEILNGASLTRISVSDIEPPPSAVVSDYDEEFPEESSLDIELDTSSDITAVYLSLIVSDVSKPKVRGVRVFDNGIEFATIPMLTKSVSSQIGDGNPVWTYSVDDAESFDSLKSRIDDEESTLNAGLLDGDYGKLATDTDVGLEFVYGEQNRPEMVLANRNKSKTNRRNDRKYDNPKMTMARELFAQVRPRFYEDVPASWVKGSISGDTVSFSAADMSKIIQDPDVETTEFALYVGRGTQIVRVPGPNISLGKVTPSIDTISPNGYIGSDEITVDGIIGISGSGLRDVIEVIFTPEGGSPYTFVADAEEGATLTTTSSSISIVLGELAYNTLRENLNVRHNVFVRNSVGGESASLPVFIGDKEDAPPAPDSVLAAFGDGEFSSATFSNNPSGIPLLSNGQNAEIKIRSKSKLFNGNYPVYAYLALPDNDESNAIMEDFSLDVRTFSSGGESMIVAADIEYEFSQSPVEDFYKLSKRRAVLRFPGSSYIGYNFSKLAGIDKAYFLLTHDSLTNLVGDSDTIDLSDASFNVFILGGNEPDDGDTEAAPAFIQPGYITGVIAEVPGGSVVSLTTGFEEDEEIRDLFDNKEISVGNISVFQTIPKLAVVFSGTDMSFMRRRHDFYLGSDKINPKITTPIKVRDNGREVLAVFRNVNSSEEGYLGLSVEVNNKDYNVKYSSSPVYGTVSSYALSDSFSLDSEDQSITTSVSITATSPLETPRIVGGEILDIAIVDQLIAPSGEGLIVDNPANPTSLNMYNPISITSSQGDITLETASVGETSLSSTKIIANATEDDVVSISRSALEIPNGSIYQRGQYLLKDTQASALFFNRIKITDPVTIGFNIPEIIGMGKTRSELDNEVVPTAIEVNAGDSIFARVRNVKKNFAIQVGSTVVKAVSPGRVKDKTATYDAQFVIPSSLAGFISPEDCLVICASTTNADRLKSKRILGNGFVIDVEERMQALMFGKAKDKIPDIEELKEILRNSPLRYLNVELLESLVPTELINSFCDLSFHLLADLKLALNGFQVLMIPIQVIFCIIDVLCALLNPVKTAKAMIRLFECLFDLVLLLPQISIPIMFLQLILHLLELLECIIDKILGIIIAINEIVAAIRVAVDNKDWASLKALEEVLSEYLYDLNVDLDILAPVISILAIFLQLLQLVFRFPCQVTPSDGSGDCVIDGTMLAGIVGGLVAPEEQILPDLLIPVAQVYTQDTPEEAIEKGTSELEIPTAGDVIATLGEDGTYLETMEVNEDTLRSEGSGLDFLVSLAVSVTKSKKGFKNPASVEFQFKGKYEPTFFISSKILDPDQSADSPLWLTAEDSGGELQVASGKGNFISPIDSKTFITKSGDTGSVINLEQEIVIPVFDVDEETGEVSQTGTQTVIRTFDRIPMMAILDEEFNLYFVDEDGIQFDDDDNVSAINATMVNNIAAPKLKFSKEDEELDTDDDGTADTEAKVYDFAQVYFVDMRGALDDINAFCDGAALNTFLLDEDNTDDVTEIVEETKDCLEEFLETIRGFGSDIRDEMSQGRVPGQIDVDAFREAVETLRECLDNGIDNMCVYVVNSLNTSFKVSEDTDITPTGEYLVPSLDSEDLDELGFEEDPPAITGATEFAEGDGDSATVGLGERATIIVTPRDSMDFPMRGDLTERIVLEIVSDDTGDAEIILNEDGTTFTKSGNDYIAYVTSNKAGEVKLRAKVCNRTIQAVTYGAVAEETEDSGADVDCVEDATGSGDLTTLGGLIKVDRILSVFFVKKSSVKLSDVDDAGASAQSTPQEFGTSLEN